MGRLCTDPSSKLEVLLLFLDAVRSGVTAAAEVVAMMDSVVVERDEGV